MSALPDMIEHLQVDLQIHEDELILFYSLNDRVNELYGCILGLSDLTAPIIGNAIFGGMKMGIFDLMALLSLLYAIVLFIFNCGPHFVEDAKKFAEEHKRMRHSEVHLGTINLEQVKIRERRATIA